METLKTRIIKFLLFLFVTAVAFSPTLMFFGAQSMLSPEGFLQQFFVLGVGIWLLGGFQFIFLSAGLSLYFLFFLFMLWINKKTKNAERPLPSAFYFV